MTDEQIIKALKYCNTDVRENTCPKCAFYKKHRCGTLMLNAVSDLINRQKAEIENLKADNDMYQKVNCLIAGQRDDRDKEIEELQTQMEWLTGYNKNLLDANTALSGEIEICKSEAIKEFAEKIKQHERIMKYDLFQYAVSVKDIDDIVKEMTEEQK